MKKHGGPAFPNDRSCDESCNGMSLRDYFAARAMHGQIGHHTNVAEYGVIAKNAYGIADAMLAEREK